MPVSAGEETGAGAGRGAQEAWLPDTAARRGMWGQGLNLQKGGLLPCLLSPLFPLGEVGKEVSLSACSFPA